MESETSSQSSSDGNGRSLASDHSTASTLIAGSYGVEDMSSDHQSPSLAADHSTRERRTGITSDDVMDNLQSHDIAVSHQSLLILL